ncbi:hypothetical protein O6H91_09G042900 [Diphasiastrum complanatum]|uniref:Uncharacterized protein n=1 Tax=Diphasiastrum complanatum TaxID=34168 RepID=A0ACC2CNH3_DIPCM|nr:hypothetical protein O6H91_09G042900 [Diphasiastrum complanatum]
MDAKEKQVQVRFSTKLPPELQVANTPFSVPSHLTRYGLSEVINALLGLEKPKPFDFIVEGDLIRTSLEKLLLAKNLSAETILNIEYTPALVPPQLQASHKGEDWFSAVNGSNSRYVFTGSYDGIARGWRANGQCSFSLEGHNEAITSVAVMPTEDESTMELLTASKDRSLRFWQITDQGLPDSLTKRAAASKVLKGHSSSVQCVSASPSGNECCSGSWDSTILLWHLSAKSSIDEEHTIIKRRKLDDYATPNTFEEVEVAPRCTLKGHTQCVSSVEWVEAETVFSASWDHSLRGWNVEAEVNNLTISCSKALHCLSVGGEGSSLLAAAGADPIIRIWDPRMPGTVAPIQQLTSHKSWISVCKWHRRSPYHLLSASHDGSVKVWDIRSKIPLQSLEGHKDKVMCADWWKGDSIVSGGADCQLQIYSNLRVN